MMERLWEYILRLLGHYDDNDILGYDDDRDSGTLIHYVLPGETIEK